MKVLAATPVVLFFAHPEVLLRRWAFDLRNQRLEQVPINGIHHRRPLLAESRGSATINRVRLCGLQHLQGNRQTLIVTARCGIRCSSLRFGRPQGASFASLSRSLLTSSVRIECPLLAPLSHSANGSFLGFSGRTGLIGTSPQTACKRKNRQEFRFARLFAKIRWVFARPRSIFAVPE
jgi:hypothetical protein